MGILWGTLRVLESAEIRGTTVDHWRPWLQTGERGEGHTGVQQALPVEVVTQQL